jgi:protein TonB
MSAEQLVLTADRADAQGTGARAQRPSLFWIALASAALVHALLIFGVTLSHPRTVGDPNGDSKAIDVELVDSSDLSMGEQASPPPGQQATPAQPQQPQQEQQPQPEPQKEAEPQKQPEPQKEPEPKPQDAQEPTPPDKDTPDATDLPAPPLALAPTPEPALPESKETAKPEHKAAPKAESKPAPKKSSPPKSVDLSVPYNLAIQGTTGDASGGSSASRPPGITRSGENDRFGRDVIRALKKTMPPSYGTRTRITIRIILDGNGNVGTLTLVQSGGKAELDQDILFSARQASYPFPPKNASVADRTFLVTYVYR